VLIISSNEEKLARAAKMGASRLINYSHHPEWHEEVLSVTANQRVDHIIEVVGGRRLVRSDFLAGIMPVFSTLKRGPL
jgi:NADPH:quinone reductase-like Zn-dependent oxidoreductase